MANLPLNETYNTGDTAMSGINLSDIRSLNDSLKNMIQAGQTQLETGDTSQFKTLQEGLDARGISTFRAPESYVTPSERMSAITNIPPRYTPPPITTENRISPISEGYKFQPGAQLPFEGGGSWPDPASEDLSLRGIPGMAGQYVLDESQPGAFLRSERSLDSSQRKNLLSGRASFLYEVDHIIPIWAGGADTAMNWEVLTKPEHREKTKSQSVPWTLWSYGKISNEEARRLAINWKQLDNSDIPEPLQGESDFGRIDLEKAEQIYERWQSQQGQPQYPEGKWKAFKDAIPASGKQKGAQLDAATEYLPPSVQGLVKGAATGLTAGWIQYNPELNDRGTAETVGNVIGNVVGMILGIGLMSAGWATTAVAVRGGGVALARYNSLANFIKNRKVISNIAKASQGISIAERIKGPSLTARTALTANKAKQATLGKLPVRSFKRGLTTKDLAFIEEAEALFKRLGPGFIGYGQAYETFQEDQNRFGRLLEDLFYGGATSFFKPGMAAKARLGALTGTFAFMFGNDEENPAQSALIMALTMMALHGPVAKGITRGAAERTLQKTIDDVSNNVLIPRAAETYSKYTGRKVTEMEIGGASQSEIAALREEALLGLDEAFFGSTRPTNKQLKKILANRENLEPDMESYIKERDNLVSLGEWLEIQSIKDVSKQTQRIVDNMISLARNADSNIAPKIDPLNLAEGTEAFKLNGALFDNSFRTFDDANNELRMKITGLAEANVGKLVPKNVDIYLKAKAQGNASPTLLGLDRSDEMASFFKRISDNPNTKWTSPNPERSVQIFGFIRNDAGQITPIELGWVPQKKHIIEQNTFRRETNAKYNTKWPELNTGLDNVWLSEEMRKRGQNFVFLNLAETKKADFYNPGIGFKMMGKGKNRRPDKTKPYLEVTVNDKNWEASMAAKARLLEKRRADLAAGRVTKTEQEETIEQILQNLNNTEDKRRIPALLRKFKQKFATPADKLLVHESAKPLFDADPAGAATLKSTLTSARKILSEPTPERMAAEFEKVFKIKLDPDSALTLFERRGEVTTQGFLEFIDTNAPQKGNLLGRALGELFETEAFQKWKYRKVFADSKILGGLEPPAGKQVTPLKAVDEPVIDITTTPATPPPGPALPGVVRPPAARGKLPITKGGEVENIVPTAQKLVSDFPRYGKTPGVAGILRSKAETPTISKTTQLSERATPTEAIPISSKKLSKEEIAAMQKEADAIPLVEQQKRAHKAIVDDLYNRAVEKMDDKQFGVAASSDPNEMRKQLRTVLAGVKVGSDTKVPLGNGKWRDFTPAEKYRIEERIKRDLNSEIERRVAFFERSADDTVGPPRIEDAADDAFRAEDEAARQAFKESRTKRIQEIEESRKAKGLTGDEKILAEGFFSERTGQAARLEIDRKTGRKILDNIEEALTKKEAAKEPGIDQYHYAWAQAMKTGLKRLFRNKSDQEMEQALGALYADYRSTTKPMQTVINPRTGKEISHTPEHIEAFGSLSPRSAVKESTKVRQEELDLINKFNKGEKLTPDELKLIGGGEDLEGMKFINPTQDENVVGLSAFWSGTGSRGIGPKEAGLYPGLNAAEVAGVEPTVRHGVRDAYAQLEFLRSVYNNPNRPTKFRLYFFEPGELKGAGGYKKGKEWNEFVNQKTEEKFRDIAKKIEQQLGVEDVVNPFPNTQIKDVVYHVDKRKTITPEDLANERTNQVYEGGMFFTTNKAYAERMAEETGGYVHKAYINTGKMKQVGDKSEIEMLGRRREEADPGIDTYLYQDFEPAEVDGIPHPFESEDAYGYVDNEIVVYDPKNIKFIGKAEKPKKRDGSGGPGYMDGEGGFIGNTFKAIGNTLMKPFRGDVIKYKRLEENVAPEKSAPGVPQTAPKTPPKAPEKPIPPQTPGTQFAGVLGAFNPPKTALTTPSSLATLNQPAQTPKVTFPSLSATKQPFDREEFRKRIVGVENEGIPEEQWYKSVGETGDLGKYQASPDTLAGWSEPWIGRLYSDEEFLNDPEAQEIFFEEFMNVAEKYGLSLDEAAVAWHRGWGQLGLGPRETREERFREQLEKSMLDEAAANYLAKFSRPLE